MNFRISALLVAVSFAIALTGCAAVSKSSPGTQSFQLTVSVTGTGTVTSAPAGINCPTTCTASFPSGTSVALTATAGTGFQFAGFGGACTGSSCQLTLSSNQSVSATFTAAGPQLTVAISGQGTVTSSPAGINCPTTCTAGFPDGTAVTLTATPSAGYNFSGYSGDCAGTTCQLTLSNGNNFTVNATFATPQQMLGAINHIIVLLQENRSFDHYFGHLMQYWQAHGYPQATNGTTFDGMPDNASNIDHAGAPIGAFNLQTGCTENPSPSWVEAHLSRNYGNPTDSSNAPMDGFAREAGGDAIANGFYDVLGHRAMGYYVGDNQLNYYYFLASNFATSDTWFTPALARTQVNRMYLYGATSEGHAFPIPQGGAALTGETIIQDMQDHGVTWKIYAHLNNDGTPGYSYIDQFTYGAYAHANFPNQFATTDQLISDMQNGTLPQVAFIEPAGNVGFDEHPGTDDGYSMANIQPGIKYVSSMINALMASPSWKDSVFILSYDEPGGFYDHVPPQKTVAPDAITFPTDLSGNSTVCANSTSEICGFYYTGYRVPLIVISPFTKKNYVSHQVMDYTAILKLIETRFNIPSLTARDQAQPDMTDFFDFVNVPWATPPANVPPQALSLPCNPYSLSSVSISPSPATAGGQATVTLSMSRVSQSGDVTVYLSASSGGVVPSSTKIVSGTTSTTLNITVPSGITSLTVTGTIGGIPVSGTVTVQ